MKCVWLECYRLLNKPFLFCNGWMLNECLSPFKNKNKNWMLIKCFIWKKIVGDLLKKKKYVGKKQINNIKNISRIILFYPYNIDEIRFIPLVIFLLLFSIIFFIWIFLLNIQIKHWISKSIKKNYRG